MRDPDLLTPVFRDAFDHLHRADVLRAMALIDARGEDWLRARTGRCTPTGRVLRVAGKAYPLKATGYLAAQLASGVETVADDPVGIDRVIRALCRCGFDVT